jgi:hypothetical protein
VSPDLVDPVEELGLVRLKVWLLDEENPQALDILDAEGHWHLLRVNSSLALAYDEFNELERFLKRLLVGVATVEDLLIDFVRYGVVILVKLLALLLDDAMVGFEVVDK